MDKIKRGIRRLIFLVAKEKVQFFFKKRVGAWAHITKYKLDFLYAFFSAVFFQKVANFSPPFSGTFGRRPSSPEKKKKKGRPLSLKDPLSLPSPK